MPEFGVVAEGFNLKGFDVILSESAERARQMFGSDIDLTAPSPLFKLLQVTASGDADIWKFMEALYYGNFISCAIGDNLDLLGEDIGLVRRQQFAAGGVTFTLTNPAPGRTYALPEGTVVITSAPVRAFYTTEVRTLSEAMPEVMVTCRAFERGPQGNVAAGDIAGIDPLYAQFHLNLGGTTNIGAGNPQGFQGGETTESDEIYRARLLGLPRNIWTLERVRRRILDVDGVLDVLLFDPLGGVDVSQSYFNLFSFNERLFSEQRRLGEPYFFDAIVAHEFSWPWRTLGAVPGVYERVQQAVDQLRPVGIHPNVIQADHIEVGLRATAMLEPGHNPAAVLTSVNDRIAEEFRGLKLGSDVLYSQVMWAFMEQAGVVDVQNLHLRRCPAAFGRVSFGAVPFQRSVTEAAAGENLSLGPTEIAVFRLDSELLDIEVVTR